MLEDEDESSDANLMISPLCSYTHEDIADVKNTLLVNISKDFHDSTLNEYINILNTCDRQTITKNHFIYSQEQISPKSHRKGEFNNPIINETNKNIYGLGLRFEGDGKI